MLILKNSPSHSLSKSTTLFHLVDLSPWPFVVSQSLLIMLSGAAIAFHGFEYGSLSLKVGLTLLVSSAALWWRDVTREGFQGQHTTPVSTGIKMGFFLFIVSEIFLFIAFFWALFHSSLSPNIELGNVWPPLGIDPINPWVVPLLNALILLSSGVTVTWAHHAIIGGHYKGALLGYAATVLLAVIFTFLMGLEYFLASFDISDSVYGSCFYMLTGLHGSHIIVAIIFLLVSVYRLYKHHFSTHSFLGAELGILYYHFVDVVFLFVFGLVYWWSSGIELSANDLSFIHLDSLFSNKETILGLMPFFLKDIKKLSGAYIKFIYFCVKSSFVINIAPAVSLFWFCEQKQIFNIFMIFYCILFFSTFFITLGINIEKSSKYIVEASGIEVVDLGKYFCLNIVIRIALYLGSGIGLGLFSDIIQTILNTREYRNHIKELERQNLSVDEASGEFLLKRKSFARYLVKTITDIFI